MFWNRNQSCLIHFLKHPPFNTDWILKILGKKILIRISPPFNFPQSTLVPWNCVTQDEIFWSILCDQLMSWRPLRQSPCWASPHALGYNHRVIATAVLEIGLEGFVLVTIYSCSILREVDRNQFRVYHWVKSRQLLCTSWISQSAVFLLWEKEPKKCSCASACYQNHCLHMLGRNSLSWWSHGTFPSADSVLWTSDFGKQRPHTLYTNSGRCHGNTGGYGDLFLAKEKSRQKGTDEERPS